MNVRPLDTVSEEGELSIYFVNSHPPAQHLVLFSMKFSGIVINLCFLCFRFYFQSEPGARNLTPDFFSAQGGIELVELRESQLQPCLRQARMEFVF